uniref:Uncharacterized protein n=1 Tax=Kalanchoe fedtschenkoi TaxID=63787 RepID=A0A7N1A942_KALFE
MTLLTYVLGQLGLVQSDKPHHIAAGAVYLACKLLNWDLFDLDCVWDELQARPAVLQDVAQQLTEVLYYV